MSSPPLSRRRRLTGLAVAVAGLPLLTLILPSSYAIPFFLAAVVGVALIGGLWPALLAAVGGFFLLNYYFTPPLHTLAVRTPADVVALGVFVVVALAVSWVVDLAARRTADARVLAEVAGSVLRSADPLDGLLTQLRDTFGLSGVTLLERVQGKGWAPAAGVGEAATATAPGVFPGGFAFLADEDLMLVLRGRSLSAANRRVVGAFAAQAAVALRQQRLAAAAEGDRVRTALLAAVSHDLRTPLASAKAAVTSLRSAEVAFSPSDQAELLETAELSLDRLTALVANLLDMSRLQAGALGLTPVSVGLEDVVPRALDELGPDGRRVTVEIPEDLPAVRADPGLLDRVLVNVIGNALRYDPSPLITARSSSGTISLLVIDHGPGIPFDQRDRVFQAFQRLGDRDNHTGVGLGLALSRGLVEAMGGSITPTDTPGGGLTMIISLPPASAEPPPAQGPLPGGSPAPSGDSHTGEDPLPRSGSSAIGDSHTGGDPHPGSGPPASGGPHSGGDPLSGGRS